MNMFARSGAAALAAALSLTTAAACGRTTDQQQFDCGNHDSIRRHRGGDQHTRRDDVR